MRSGLFLLLLCPLITLGQVVPIHHTNNSIYDFLSEMASLKVVQYNDVVRPLSRVQVHDLLVKVRSNEDKLCKRQKDELAFFWKDFIKEDDQYRGLDFLGRGLKRGDVFPLRKREKRLDLFFYKDSLFNITINPIWGGEGFLTGTKPYYHSWVGASLFGNITKHFSFYATIIDNTESEQLMSSDVLYPNMGAVYKGTLKDYSEMRGGMSASAKWGYLSIVKDHFVWGSGYNGSIIFSGRNPSIPQIKLGLTPVEWFSFDYIHGWLNSDLVDSAATYQSGNGNRELYISKFLAANMFTVRPIKGLYFSFGNSVVYSDKFNPVYLIPFLFYKSVDHTLGATGNNAGYKGQNSQMFVNLVSRQIKYLELYSSVFIDEIRTTSITNSEKQRNHVSFKVGFRFTAPKNVNLSAIFEYTRNNPATYQHFVPSTTYASNGYNLGHYLGDNADEYFGKLIYSPVSRLKMSLTYLYARKGELLLYDSIRAGQGLEFMKNKQFVRQEIGFVTAYEIANDVKVKMSYRYLLETGVNAQLHLPDAWKGNPHTVSLSLQFGGF
ncbi:MAG: hypothetical protein K9G46_13570 [Flavobacteriales bacterium]|nr:hypothetical protein [Flavobacteriales bacterium]